MVCDKNNRRIQVFELNGKFVGKFGSKGEFMDPWSVAVLSNDRIVVADQHKNCIDIFELF